MRKTAALAVAGVLLALGAGGYYAWQEGMVPASVIAPHPRAPLAENFLATLQRSAPVAQSLRPACLRLNLHAGRDIDRMGRIGLAHQRMPGWDVIVVAQVPGSAGQRIGKLTEALDALAKAGIYSATEAETEDTAGEKVPARAYSLTFAGWNQMLDEGCFRIGKPQITELTEISRITPDKDGKRVYEVKARYAPQDVEPWVDDPAVQSFVSEDHLKQVREPATASFRLVRTDTGWTVERPENDVPELTEKTVTDLVAKAAAASPPQACIRLPGNGNLPGLEVHPAPYAVTIYEGDGRGDIDSRFLAELMWQTRFAQLVSAGVFAQETMKANPKLNAPAGTRFVLDPAYQRWVDMNDARCLRMGETTLEFVSLSMHPQHGRERTGPVFANATAKFVLRLAKDAWIEKVALSLPEVAAVKEAGGVPVLVRLTWSDRDKIREWRLASLQPAQAEPTPPRRPRIYQSSTALAASPAVAAPAYPSRVPAAALEVHAAGGDVTWRFGSSPIGGRVSNEGLTASYCCAGASSTTLASRTVGSGKVYAEFTFAARPRALKADTWTTIGILATRDFGGGDRVIMVPPGANTFWPQRNSAIEHEDVIGIAIDLDGGQVYFSRNGTWMNGQPGSGGGIPIARGQPYAVAAVLSASSASLGSDSWTANFGKTRFRHGLPRGFRSYDGRQKG